MLITHRQKPSLPSQAPHNCVNLQALKPSLDEMKKSDFAFPRLASGAKHVKPTGAGGHKSDEDDVDDNTKILSISKPVNGPQHGGTGGGRSTVTMSSSNASAGQQQQQQQHLPTVPYHNNSSHNQAGLVKKPSFDSIDTTGTNDDSKAATRTSQSFGPANTTNTTSVTVHNNAGNIRRASTWEGFLDQMVDQVQLVNRPPLVPSSTPRRTNVGVTGTLTRNNTTMFGGSSSNLTPSTTPRGSQVHFQIGVARRPPVMRPLKEGVVDAGGEYDGSVEQSILAASQNTELFHRVKAWLEDLPKDMERPVTPVIVEDEPRPLEATFTFVHNDR